MNREKISEIARECGMHYWDMDNLCFQQSQDMDLLEAFAAAIRAATKEEDAMICEDEAKIRTEAGQSHPEDSESRSRCFSAARAAINCAVGIRASK